MVQVITSSRKEKKQAKLMSCNKERNNGAHSNSWYSAKEDRIKMLDGLESK